VFYGNATISNVTEHGNQHRFMETAIGSLAAGWATKIAGTFGYVTAADLVRTIGNAFIGDYLHTF
jgi:hypothetical protein